MESRRQRGDRVPHFSVARLGGGRAEYAETWQRRNLLLVTLPAAAEMAVAAEAYAAAIAAHSSGWAESETDLVITTDPVSGVPSPGVLVADRWGEIHGAWYQPTPDRLPAAEELAEWLRYLQQVCPECQGEAY